MGVRVGERKQCSKCERVQPLANFTSRPKTLDGLEYQCKDCRNQSIKEYRASNRSTVRSKSRQWYLERTLRGFGLSLENYQTLLDSQDGRCAICGKLEWYKRPFRLAIDHNHRTGQMRGLLCSHCNKTLGILEKDDWLINAMAYLEEYNAIR